MWLSIGIDYQYQLIYKLVSIGTDWLQDEWKRNRQIKNTTLWAVILNTFYFNVNMRTIFSSFSSTLTPINKIGDRDGLEFEKEDSDGISVSCLISVLVLFVSYYYYHFSSFFLFSL